MVSKHKQIESCIYRHKIGMELHKSVNAVGYSSNMACCVNETAGNILYIVQFDQY